MEQMNHSYTQQYRLSKTCLVKEARHLRILHTGGFYLHKTGEQEKLKYRVKE